MDFYCFGKDKIGGMICQYYIQRIGYTNCVHLKVLYVRRGTLILDAFPYILTDFEKCARLLLMRRGILWLQHKPSGKKMFFITGKGET